MAAAKLSFKRREEAAAPNKMASLGDPRYGFVVLKDGDHPDRNSLQFWNEPFNLLLCILMGLCLRVSSGVRKRRKRKKKPLMCSQYGTSATMEELKNPALAGGGGS